MQAMVLVSSQEKRPGHPQRGRPDIFLQEVSVYNRLPELISGPNFVFLIHYIYENYASRLNISNQIYFAYECYS